MASLIPRPKPPSESEKYDVIEKIGHGSFGIIHKVRRKADGLILCRKEISYVRMTTKEREQLSAELSILKEVRHRNIVAYYEREHFRTSQDLHLYMEYCGNGDLGRYIKTLKQRGLYADEDFVWTVLSQLATALYRCHYGADPPDVRINALGFSEDAKPASPVAGPFMILHRDLKPENVFLDENNAVKLGDFGLSKILQSQGFAETYVGTPFYMSPEICNGEKYTLYSDVWSLGCILYELCARQPPFNASTHLALIQRIKIGKTARIPAQYSNELQEVISSCLAVNPNRRPDTADLLQLPRVKLMRKEQLLVDWASQLDKKAVQLNDQIAAVRDEAETRVRRECEAACHADHGRFVEAAKQDALRTLQTQFEAEVSRRVAAEVEAQVRTVRAELEQRYLATGRSSSSSSTTSSSSSSNAAATSASSGPDEGPKPPTGSGSSFDSGLGPKLARSRLTRTPFGRAQTVVGISAPSPMDITMVDPTPGPAPPFGLSPRRAISIPNLQSTGASSLSAVVEMVSSKRWRPGRTSATPSLSTEDESDGDVSLDADPAMIDTPSRVRPVGIRPVSSQPSIRSNLPKFKLPPSFDGPSKSAGLRVVPSSRRPISAVPVIAPSPTKRAPTKALQPCRPAPGAPQTSRVDRSDSDGSSTEPAFKSKRGNEALLKTALHGRTLVELSQARTQVAGAGRSSSATLPLTVVDADVRRPSTTAGTLAISNAYADPPTWDPSKDMMPSPFIVRSRRPDDVML